MYEGTYPHTTQKPLLSGWHDVASAALRENVDVRGYLPSHNSAAGHPVLSGWHDVASAALRENVDVRGYLPSHSSVAGPEYCSRGAGLLQSPLSLSNAQLQKVVVVRAGARLQLRVEHLAVER